MTVQLNRQKLHVFKKLDKWAVKCALVCLICVV